MSKIIQVVVYKSVSDEEKLAKYAALARPSLTAAGCCVLARGVPVTVKETGEATGPVVLEWNSLGAAEKSYAGDGCQATLAALGGGAVRDIRYIEAV